MKIQSEKFDVQNETNQHLQGLKKKKRITGSCVMSLGREVDKFFIENIFITRVKMKL